MAKVLHCGEEPGECGKFSDAVAEYDLELAVPLGTGTLSGTCYVMSGATTQDRLLSYQRAYGTVAPGSYSEAKYYVRQANAGGTWTLVPFYVGIKAKLVLSYNSSAHLIATLKNIRSAVLDARGSMTRQGTYPYCTAGDFGLGLAITLSPFSPSASDGSWKKCFGGWWSGSRSCAGGTCYAGCTYYRTAVWNDFGSKYSHSGAHPTRRDSDTSWDLGVIDNPENYNVFVYGRGVRGNCATAHFDARDGAKVARNFDVPPMNICPPSIDKVEMARDICENTVSADLTVSIPELGVNDVDLVVGWVAANSESEALSHGTWQSQIVEDVSENTTIEVPLATNLIPNTTYYFRAYLTNSSVSSDTVLSCDNLSLYMPKASCAVPMLSEEECETLISGDCLAELTAEDEEVCC